MCFEELLARDGKLVYKTRGVSMEPMLRQNRDLVVIQTPTSRLRKYDVALYRRGQSYVLHRVIGLASDHYLIRGDNTYAVEHVPESDVIGVLTAFTRKGRQFRTTDFGYRLYARVWCAIYPLRLLRVRTRRLAVRTVRKAGLEPLLKRLLGRA